MTELWAECGINHQGSLELAIKMIQEAKRRGADLVKFQMRVPELAVPKEQQDKLKTWQGQEMTYLEYKKRLELGRDDYSIIAEECEMERIGWSASVWDIPSLNFLMNFDVPWIKIPSAKLTDENLLEAATVTGKPLVISTGMSTMAEIEQALRIVKGCDVTLMHCNSSYPSADAEQDLDVIRTLNYTFLLPVGFSSHSKSPYPALYAAARYDVPAVEVHFTLDRSMEGTDHASSLEADGLELLAREFRRIPIVVGSRTKQVYDSELPSRLKLRGY